MLRSFSVGASLGFLFLESGLPTLKPLSDFTALRRFGEAKPADIANYHLDALGRSTLT